MTGALAGGRAFVDATGTPVPLRGPIRRVVATDPEVGALLLELGATVVGCAGVLADVPGVGADRRPDAREVAALRPDAIITGTRERRHDLADPAGVEALRRIAPVMAVDLTRASGAVARADLRALLGPPARRAVAPPPVDLLGELDPGTTPVTGGADLAALGPKAAALVREVTRSGRAVVVTDGGREVAAIISSADHERLRALENLVRLLRLEP